MIEISLNSGALAPREKEKEKKEEKNFPRDRNSKIFRVRERLQFRVIFVTRGLSCKIHCRLVDPPAKFTRFATTYANSPL